MGGQACVFYGAAEFSRDCDIVIVANDDNLACLNAALDELQARCIAVPPKDWKYLDRGHAIHFRCRHPDAAGIRLDVMTKMRGCDEFDELWKRRTTIEDEAGGIYELLGIDDLVKAKKTQRDKDWPMIRRLVDAHYDQNCDEETAERVRFWLRESRTPEVLIRVAADHPDVLREEIAVRPLLTEAESGNATVLQQELNNERDVEMQADADYWRPLIQELESLRRQRTSKQESQHSDPDSQGRTR